MYNYKKYKIKNRDVICIFDDEKENINTKIEEIFRSYFKDRLEKLD